MYRKMFFAFILCFSFAMLLNAPAYAGPSEGCDDPYQIITNMKGDINEGVGSRTIRTRLNVPLDSCEKKVPGALQGDIRSENYAVRYVEQLKMYIQRYMKTNDIDGETGDYLLQQADDLINAITCVDCYKDLTVFVSSNSYYGDLNGITGADRTCQELADDTGLSGTYKAWLSTSRGYSPANSWDHSDQNYVLTDNETIIAYDWNDLTDGELDNAIWRDQYAWGQSNDVWTGTYSDGYPAGSFGDASEFCNDWTSDSWSNEALYGLSYWISYEWTDNSWEDCDYDKHIYCFEQVDPRWDSRCNQE